METGKTAATSQQVRRLRVINTIVPIAVGVVTIVLTAYAWLSSDERAAPKPSDNWHSPITLGEGTSWTVLPPAKRREGLKPPSDVASKEPPNSTEADETTETLAQVRKALETIASLKNSPDTQEWATAELSGVEKWLRESEQTLGSKKKPSPSRAELLAANHALSILELKLLKQDMENTKAWLKLELESTRLSLKQELESASSLHAAGLASVKEDVGRVYDWVKWLFGGGVGLAVLLLAVNTYLAARGKPAGESPPEQEEAS